MADTLEHPVIQTSRTALRALGFWHQTMTRALRDMPYDLSSRQMSILLSIYILPPPHSIKSLAEDLMISKPAVCRAVDVLEHLKFVRRIRDANDRRSVLVQRTVKGSVFLSDFADIIVSASREAA